MMICSGTHTSIDFAVEILDQAMTAILGAVKEDMGHWESTVRINSSSSSPGGSPKLRGHACVFIAMRDRHAI